MPVKADAAGRRIVQIEVEVPGTPEQVWQKIATADGISSWFVRTDVEEREGGAMAFHLETDAPPSPATITAYEQPRRLVYEERDWAPNAPPLATELTVEARDGGTCVVRLVHSLFASGQEWDDQLEGFEAGWPPFFEVLRLSLAHFAGRPFAAIRLVGSRIGSQAEVWNTLKQALGLAGVQPGQRTRRPEGDVPPVGGVVELVGEGAAQDVLVKLDEPAMGVGLFGVFASGERITIVITLYLFGDDAAEVAARDQPLWSAWLSRAPVLSS